MKKFRALTASILASAMAMSMTAGFAAFAAEGDTATAPVKPEKIQTKNNDDGSVTYVVSVTKKAGDKEAHTYEAYKIFEATMSGNDLTVTDWATGVKSDELLVALKADTTFGADEANLFANAASAADVADVLSENFTYDDENIQAFAKVVGKHLGTAAKTVTGTADANVNYTDIEVGGAGYYLIKESDATLADKNSAKTRYILTPTNTINPELKADYPTIEKKIIENDVPVDFNTASIGDTVTYQLTSYVPDMKGYNKYFYIVNDTLFEGLDLNEKTFEIKIGNTPLNQVDAPTADDAPKTQVTQTFYVVTDDTVKKDVDGDNKEENCTGIKIVFEDFIQYKAKKDEAITITYNATLNEKAKIGSEGNPNFVDLTFSNDPNHEYKGTPGNPPDDPDKPGKPNEPGSDDPMGKTPEDKVITYTAGIELTKVDLNDPTKRLTGAIFKIEGDGIKWVVNKSYEFEESESGTYYKLKDGTYTEEAPTEETEDSYADIETKYECKEKIDVLNKNTGKTVIENLEVDDEGVLRIHGLNAGTYTITETQAPKNYIKGSKTDTNITIGIAEDEETNKPKISLSRCEWAYTSDNGIEKNVNDDGIFTFKITNPKGVVLPGTGAFGSKLMYALGTLFTGAGAAYMISKKKSKKEEE